MVGGGGGAYFIHRTRRGHLMEGGCLFEGGRLFEKIQ